MTMWSQKFDLREKSFREIRNVINGSIGRRLSEKNTLRQCVLVLKQITVPI